MTDLNRACRIAARPLLCAGALAVLTLAAAMHPEAVAAQEPWTGLFPGRIDGLKRCDDFDMTVEVWSADRLAGFQVEVRFNPTVLDFVSAEVAPWLENAWQGHTSLPPVVTGGNVLYAATSDPGSHAPSGDGELALLRFRAIAGGTSDLDLHDVYLIDSDFVTTAVTSTDAIVIVEPIDGPGCLATPTFTPTPTVSATATATSTGTPVQPTPGTGSPVPTATVSLTPTPPTASPTASESAEPPTITPIGATATEGVADTPTAVPSEATPTAGPERRIYLPATFAHPAGAPAVLAAHSPERSPAAQGDIAIVRIQPAFVAGVAPGGVFSVDVWIDNPVELGGFQFTLDYDAQVIEFEKAEIGALLGSTGREVIELPVQEQEGTFTYGAASLPGAPGPSLSGQLARVTFRGVADGSTTLSLRDVKITDTDNNPQPAQAQGGRVSIRSSIYLPYSTRP